MRMLAVLAGLAVLAVAGAALFVYSGVYNVAATEQHTAPVYWVLEQAMRRSVSRRAGEIDVPPLTEDATIARGLRLYHADCVPCHGAPGVSPDAFALGMMPVPANLALTAREWKPAEVYWVVRHGVKTSGMPAWEFRLSDADLWAVVAFVATLPTLSPDEYRARLPAIAATSGSGTAPQPSRVKRGDGKGGGAAPGDVERGEARREDARRGDAERGEVALQQYACVACHAIPGVVGANKPVGPSLAGIASRKYLAGVVPNSRDNMVRWLRSPQELAPHSAMPDLGVSEDDARDIATFLDALK